MVKHNLCASQQFTPDTLIHSRPSVLSPSIVLHIHHAYLNFIVRCAAFFGWFSCPSVSLCGTKKRLITCPVLFGFGNQPPPPGLPLSYPLARPRVLRRMARHHG